MHAILTVVGMVSFLAGPPNDPARELGPPTRILVGGQPVDVDMGNAAPFMGDVDGDGIKDLLVGQFADGKLRVYRNVGTNQAPRFDKFTWFLDGKESGRVPAG